jgi:ferritin-like metal-binding protein YciE
MFGTVKSLSELFELGLSYVYDCEQKLVEKGLPAMIKGAGSNDLRSALEQHLQETRNHVARLERVFSTIGKDVKAKNNEIFNAMASAAKDSISNIEDAPIRDAALVVNGNMVEHYEIAAYGSLASFARHLGLHDVVSLLQETLEEEKKADATLTQIGEKHLNPLAVKRQGA